MNKTNRKKPVIDSLKRSAEFLIWNAEKLVPDVEYLTDLNIYIKFENHGETIIPQIDMDLSFMPDMAVHGVELKDLIAHEEPSE